jgi:hypothetical protein
MFRRGDLITTGGYVGRGPLISRPRRARFNPLSLPGLAAWYDASDSATVLTQVGGGTNFVAASSQSLTGVDDGLSNVNPTQATWNVWAKLGTLTSSQNHLLNKGFGGGGRAYNIHVTNTGLPRFIVYHDGGVTNLKEYRPTFVINNGSWRMLTMTFDNGEFKIFVDGVELTGAQLNKVADVSFTTINQSTASLFIGSGGSSFSDHDQDETAIWNRALSNAEIATLYNSGAGRTYAEAPASLKTNLVSWWSMNAPTSGNWLDQHGTNHLTPSASRPTATTGVTFNVAQDGQTVRRWLDKSGAGRHLNQTDLVNQPTLNTSVSGVVGNGTSAFMTASFPVLEPQTIYFVAIANTNVSGHRFMDGMATNRNMLRNLSGGLNALTGASNVSVTGDIFQRFIGGAVFASAGAGAFYGLTFAAGTLSNGVTDALGLTLLSSNGGGSNWLDGIIFERISYGAAHDAATRERVIRYLARKWGITV